MKTKTFSMLVASILIVATSITAQTTCQYVTLTSGKDLTLQTNQIVTIVGYDWSSVSGSYNTATVKYVTTSPQIIGKLPNANQINLSPFINVGYIYLNSSANSQTMPSLSSQIPQTVTGLTNVSVSGGWTTLKIETPSVPSVVSNYIPADAIVIPSSVTGNVQIILESSQDLVNWNAANPGIYGSTAGTNRFFRVRAVVN